MIKLTAVTIIMLLFTACTSDTMENQRYDFDLQGHRGARGLLPENTIPSFIRAVDLGVDTIEFDLVVTADSQVLISHEPWFHHQISTKPDGSPVLPEEAANLNIFEMTYEETTRFDVGIRGHVDFPEQQPVAAIKPLMRDAIYAVEAHTRERGLDPVWYNVEIKSRPDWYGVMVPEPEEYVRLVYEDLKETGVLDRINIQSFDVNPLIAMRGLDPDVPLALLVSNDDSLEENLGRLGFVPEIYSPAYRLVTRDLVEQAHAKGMLIIPWTINETEEMRRQLEMGVDGIITDYPDRAAPLRQNRRM